MSTHFVYLAGSLKLAIWSTEQFGRMAVKVGTSRNPGQRERWLNGVNPITDAQVYSCCGCRDWKVVWKRRVGSEEAALEFEAKFKEAFDLFQVWGDHAPPWYVHREFDGDRTAMQGESDLVLLPETVDLFKLDPVVRSAYRSARGEVYRAFSRDVPELIVPEETEADRDWEEQVGIEAARRSENLDNAERLLEEGYYYED